MSEEKKEIVDCTLMDVFCKLAMNGVFVEGGTIVFTTDMPNIDKNVNLSVFYVGGANEN